MSKEIPESIKNNIKAVLLSKHKGITLPEFLSDYRTQQREPLRFRDFGFSTVQEFMEFIPDVVRVMTASDSQIRVFGVGDLNSSVPATFDPRVSRDSFRHVPRSSLVEHSFNVNGVPHLVTNGGKTDNEYDDLIPDKMGLWSVCIPLSVWQNKGEKELDGVFRQAGDVKKVNLAERHAFIRYASKEEALLAVKSFPDLKARLAHNHFRNTEAKSKMNKSMGNTNSVVTEIQPHIKDQINRLHSEMNSNVQDRNTVINKDPPVLEKLFGQFYKDFKLNGSHSEKDKPSEASSTCIPSHKDEWPHTDTGKTHIYSICHQRGGLAGYFSVPRNALYFGNIESVDDFKELIKPYDPDAVNIKIRDGKTIAFASVKSIDCAKQAIKDLHNKLQRTKPLFVNFAKHDMKSGKGDSDSLSGDSSFESQHDAPRTMERKPKLIEMPPLIPVSALGPDADKYQLECCVYVANFPVNTLESVLRNAFEKYHILDVCMVNNGSGPGCTKAFLYLTTVYDVIQAVIEMDKSCVFGRPLQVEVPVCHTLLKAIVDEAISRERASSYH